MINQGIHSHVVICNWNQHADSIVKELHADVIRTKRPIIIITPNPADVPSAHHRAYQGVFIINGDPTDERFLRRAHLDTADSAIILADRRKGESADAYSIIIALAVESINPDVYTIVELLNHRNKIHFAHTQVDELVCVEEISEKVIAQSAITHGISEVYLHLLSATRDSNEIYIVPVPAFMSGWSFGRVTRWLDGKINIIPIGFINTGERLVINPEKPESARLEPGARLIVLAYEEPDLTTFKEHTHAD